MSYLSAKKQLECVKKWQDHRDIQARNMLVVSNLGTVYNIANRFRGFEGKNLEDLYQEGAIGLIEAVDKFDSSKGVKFSTYSTYRIRQKIIRYLQNNREKDLPVYLQERMSAVKKALKKLDISNTNDKISDNDLAKIANETGLNRRIVTKTLNLIKFDSVIHFEDNPSKEKLMASSEKFDVRMEDDVEKKAGKQKLIEFIQNLPYQSYQKNISEKYVTIFLKYNGLYNDQKYTFAKLAEEYSLSAERIRNINTIVLNCLKGLIKTEKFGRELCGIRDMIL